MKEKGREGGRERERETERDRERGRERERERERNMRIFTERRRRIWWESVEKFFVTSLHIWGQWHADNDWYIFAWKKWNRVMHKPRLLD